ncbi:hypothetical protein psal_cds_961 [Pandoravirus salinus]|uniref:F-box incomplete domain containing protein n=1 Tax=Pandoravirus salinus TaxID=1349410 RepID=S4W008_9VIRU|nr:hypothetical protein psal_cds_961 [Pandoravirus salinus]AGO85111.1 hypothetical protein psal_cds_961 [Pandoravirus salinus]
MWSCFCRNAQPRGSTAPQATVDYAPLAHRFGRYDTTHKKKADDRDRPRDEPQVLPPELWSIILDMAADASEDRYMQARVCRLWRRVVLSRSRERKCTTLLVGAEVCRARIAHSAIYGDNQSLFAWAIQESLAAPLPRKLVYKFWRRICIRDALGCAAIMRIVGPWPLPCDRAKCRCSADPPSTIGASVVADPRDHTKIHAKCRRMKLVTLALAHRSLSVSSLFLAWGVSHPAHWARSAVLASIVGGHIDVLDLMWSNGVAPHVPRTAMHFGAWRTVTWAQCAAKANQPASLAWVVKHLDSVPASASASLVDAARSGASDSVAWLCQRQHLDWFAEALVAASAGGHEETLAVMAPFIAAARGHLEASGISLDHAVSTEKSHKALTHTQKTRLLTLLRGRPLDVVSP